MGVESLLHELIQNTCSTLPESDRKLENVSSDTIIYNLFRGDYKFSENDYRELFKLLRYRDMGTIETPSVGEKIDKQIKSFEESEAEKRFYSEHKILYTPPYDTQSFPGGKRRPKPVTKRAKLNIVPALPPPNPYVLGVTFKTECFYCQKIFSDSGWDRTSDHVMPKSKGGKRMGNLVYCCKKCNGLKSNMTLLEFKSYLEHEIIRIKRPDKEEKYPHFSEYIIYLQTIVRRVEFLIEHFQTLKYD